MGPCLLNDNTGQLIDAIRHDKGESKYILDEIFRRWMTGEGKECSWEGLIECLRFAKLIVLAEELESACARENKHADPLSETFSTLLSSTPTPHAKEKEQVKEQLKRENYSNVIYSVISAVIISFLCCFFGRACNWFKDDSTPGTEVPSHIRNFKFFFVSSHVLALSPSQHPALQCCMKKTGGRGICQHMMLTQYIFCVHGLVHVNT